MIMDAYLKNYVFASAVVYKFLALQKWWQLYLVHCRRDGGISVQLLKMANPKIADAYAFA